MIGAHLLLLLAEQPRHGYEMAEILRAWEFEGITASKVYRELARLEDDGLVRSFWQTSQARGPARHMYDLTEAGRSDLVVCAEDLRGLMSHLTAFLTRLSTVDGGPPPDPDPEPEPEAGGGNGAVRARRRRWGPRN